jgi:hypothetical protein
MIPGLRRFWFLDSLHGAQWVPAAEPDGCFAKLLTSLENCALNVLLGQFHVKSSC